MDTQTTDAFAGAHTARRRSMRPLLVGVGVVFAVLALLVLAFVGLRFSRVGALPGTVVNGVDVGGLQGERLQAAVAGSGNSDLAVTIIRGNERFEATGEELGYRLDVETTVEAVMARGRQSNPVDAVADHIRAFNTTTEVPAEEFIDEDVLAASMAEAAEALNLEVVEGDLQIAGAAVTPTEPRAGAVVDTRALEDMVRETLLEDGPLAIEAPVDTVEPVYSAEVVADAQALAERAVSAPVELTRGETTLTFTPEQIGDLLRVQRQDGEIGLAIAGSDVAAEVPSATVEELSAEAVDATITLVGDTVEISESSEGFTFDPDATAAQLLAVATSEGERSVALEGDVDVPALSTEDAEALGIVERVSAFTTEHACCQGRVTNIHRMADLVDGVIIEPGETFSLNDHVGERTAAKGFVAGGAIQNGLFVQEVGGGVSQFTTTMFNAAFFGGYAIPDYKAHSYYISRYPVGREATLNYPTVDLKIENNSPHGILVDTSYTDTSITVSFWGTKWVEVTDITGERHNVTSADTRTVENPDLPPGASRVTSTGGTGFDIVVTRILTFPDGREEREEFFTRYLAEPRIVERNSG